MGSEGPAARFLRRLEGEVSHAVDDRGRVILAFSGGLGSLVVGALIRKRCDLRCVVAGLLHSPDLEAAVLAERFLDYRLEAVALTPARALAIAKTLSQRHPVLPAPDLLSLVPLVAAWERGAEVSGFAGLKSSPPGAEFMRVAETLPLISPLICTAPQAAVPRARLLALSRMLAIPDAFAHVSARSPAVGSGVAPALRALSKEEGVSLERLLRSTDYHQ